MVRSARNSEVGLGDGRRAQASFVMVTTARRIEAWLGGLGQAG